MRPTGEMPLRVYTPESALRHPLQLLRAMAGDLAASRELAWRLFVRDTSARYRQSLLGYLWAFLPPLAATFTFVLLNQNGILQTRETPVPYPAYVLIGTLLWQVFVDAINGPIKNVAAAKSMLTKINFPREAILLSCVYEVSFNFAIRLLLLAAFMGYYGIVPPATMPLALVGVFAIFCLGFLIGTLLAPVSMLYGDVGQALPILLSFGMLITPVVYVPPSSGVLSRLTEVNPLSPLILSTRELLVAGFSNQISPALVIFAATFILLIAGWIAYRLAMPILIERIGS